MSREEAIQHAAQFANANGYRVEPSFEGLVWNGEANEPRPVKFDAARFIEGEWVVLFDKMLPPEILCESPAETIVIVAVDRTCRFFDAL